MSRVPRGLVPLVSKPVRPLLSRQTPAAVVNSLRQAHTRANAVSSPSSRRPRLQPAFHPSPLLPTTSRRSIFIQTEPTPNPDALKFLPNHKVLPEGIQTSFIEYLSPRSTIAPPYPSPLASQLMAVDGVKSVFYGPDFITVTKETDANWAHIRPEVFSLITEAISAGQPIVNVAQTGATQGGEAAQMGEAGAAQNQGEQEQQAEKDSLAYDPNDDEVVGMIKELLETRVRPAIQEDGGDIEFRGFKDGYVHLKLRGACRTCDSSTVTLKNGIEGMLMHYVSFFVPFICRWTGANTWQIEEVKGVVQVLDEEEEIARREFQKFEEKLKQQKGQVPPSLPIDSVN